MTRTLWPVLNTILFTIFVPGTVAVYVPIRLLGGLSWPVPGPLSWLGGVVLVVGAAIYFRCAWEFAVRGLGTPAPIAPTKFLVVTALHRYMRNPMYIGSFSCSWGKLRFFENERFSNMPHSFTQPSIFSSCFMRSPRCTASSARRMKNTAGQSRAGSHGFEHAKLNLTN